LINNDWNDFMSPTDDMTTTKYDHFKMHDMNEYYSPATVEDNTVWDIGFNIGSNFLTNSFLCPSKDRFPSMSLTSGDKSQALEPICKRTSFSTDVNSDDNKHGYPEKSQVVAINSFQNEDSTASMTTQSRQRLSGRFSKKKSNKNSKRRRKNLSIREDVMNKNVLRALKRELITMFDSFKSSDSSAKFMVKVKEFSDNLLLKLNYDPNTNRSFNTSDYYIYVGIFINY